MRYFTALLVALLLAPLALFAQSPTRTILVLDASGSMWGQIGGKAKITIAQEVIVELLRTLPGEAELGLTVYGHRRKGDCGDIETLIFPGRNQRAAIANAVNAIQPKGKTPLSAAVIAAAEALRYTQERATVILVSDGKETCNFDPCEVGRRLEAAGVDFTAHVIGFDIADPIARSELQCLAAETGGTFHTASNAAELAQALSVVAEPEPAAFDLTFIATQGVGGPVITEGLFWSLGVSRTGPFMAQSQPGPNIGFAQIPETTPLFVQVVRAQDGAVAELTLVVDRTTPATSVLVLPDLPPEPVALTGMAVVQAINTEIKTPLIWTIMDSAGRVLVANQTVQRPMVSVLPGVYYLTVVRVEDGATVSQQVVVRKLQPLTAVLKLPELVEPVKLTIFSRVKSLSGGRVRSTLIWTLFDANGQVILDHVTGSEAKAVVVPGRYRIEVLRTDTNHTEVREFTVGRGGLLLPIIFPR